MLDAVEQTSELLSKLRKRNYRRKAFFGISAALLSGSLVFSAINIQNIASGFNDIVNPVPEKVFVELSKKNKNLGWLSSIDVNVQLESNKPNAYKVVLEMKAGSNWNSLRESNVEFTPEKTLAKNFTYHGLTLEPGSKELRIRVLRKEDSRDSLVEISKPMKFQILKRPLQNAGIAVDSNNTIIWRFAKETEKPQYCSKVDCYFIKIASTKRCLIKATLLLKNKEVSINSARGSSIGSVAAYTPKKSYLIEVPYNSANIGLISARCFALRSGSNQGSTPTPTKEPQNLTASAQQCWFWREEADKIYTEQQLEMARFLNMGDIAGAARVQAEMQEVPYVQRLINSRC